jgi:hypothetical protein
LQSWEGYWRSRMRCADLPVGYRGALSLSLNSAAPGRPPLRVHRGLRHC